MEKLDIQAIREDLADRFQALADSETQFRLDSAEQIGELIANTSPEWSTTAGVAGAVITDKTDGFWHRIAKAVRGYDKPTDGAENDPKADHKLTEALLGGLAARAARMGDIQTFTKVEDNLRRIKERNERIDAHRAKIKDSGIDKRELRANRFNKVKFALHGLGATALASPLSNNRLARRASLSVLTAGTRCGEIGEQKFGRKVAQLMAKNSAGKSLSD